MFSRMLQSSPEPEKISTIVRGYMPILNGYYGIAVLLVFVFHCISELAAQSADGIATLYKKL